jgi:hypothetical protein
MRVRRKRFFAVIATVFAVVGIALSYVFYYYLSRNLVEVKAIRVSKQSPAVQRYLRWHPNAKARVSKMFITGDGIVYSVDDNWELIRKEGSASKTVDGKDHYCWKVFWHDPTCLISHVVYVGVDKDSWEIVYIDEAL